MQISTEKHYLESWVSYAWVQVRVEDLELYTKSTEKNEQNQLTWLLGSLRK